ncbi:TPA: hypothetical protein ACQ301_000060 [Yersinia enterocolitica]
MKELDSFTVERLEKWISAGEAAKNHHDGVRVAGEYLAALARIALAAKVDHHIVESTENVNSPEGWKLVPNMPTLGMLSVLGLTGSFESMLGRYADMLYAAPEKENG